MRLCCYGNDVVTLCVTAGFPRDGYVTVKSRYHTVSPHEVHLVHDDVIKWKHFPCYWPFVRGIHRFPVNSPHKGQWRGALIFSLICVWINGWVNNREAGDLRRYRAHYDVSVMVCVCSWLPLDSFMSCLHALLGFSTGEFQALQLIVLAACGAVD